MEDIVAYFLMASLAVLFIYIPYSAYKFIKRSKQRAEEAQRQHEEHLATLKKERQASWDRMSKGATHVGKTQYDYIADQKRTTVTEKATGRQMSYVHHNEDGPDLLTTMIVADMLLNHKDTSSGTVSWKNDVPSVSTSSYSSSSDDDSRKSSSWFSDSSPSYSDSGPSYSSSSDSGPSSDW